MNLTKAEEKGSYDVIVAGGGVAGAAAALAAVRRGKSVLLIEKSLFFGGLATYGLINLFVPMCNGRGRQIIKGMAEEFLRLSIRSGFDSIPEEWKNGEPGEGAKTRYITRFSSNIFSMELGQLLHKEGVSLLLDTVVTQPVMEGNHCRGLIVENKSGRGYYKAGVVIDTTGDGEVLYRAGVPMVQGGNYDSYSAIQTNLELMQKAVESQNIEKGFSYICGGTTNLYGYGQPEGKPLYKGVTAEEITQYVLEQQEVLLGRLNQTERSTREVITLPGMPQFRTVRHIDGEYTMTTADEYRHFEDSIGAICDFERRDYLYEVPYRCLYHREFDNLLTAGRIAAGEGYLWDVLRVIPPAILTGQAVGEAAVAALEQGCGVGQVDIALVQKRLEEGNVMIHFEDDWIPQQPSNEPELDYGHF